MEYFGGNGHINSSGCKIDSVNIYRIIDSVITRTKIYLAEYYKQNNIVLNQKSKNGE